MKFFIIYAYSFLIYLIAVQAISVKILKADLTPTGATPSESIARFHKLMLTHSVQRLPHSCVVFDENLFKKANEYMLSSYYRHFRLYQYNFTKRTVVNIAQRGMCDVDEE